MLETYCRNTILLLVPNANREAFLFIKNCNGYNEICLLIHKNESNTVLILKRLEEYVIQTGWIDEGAFFIQTSFSIRIFNIDEYMKEIKQFKSEQKIHHLISFDNESIMYSVLAEDKIEIYKVINAIKCLIYTIDLRMKSPLLNENLNPDLNRYIEYIAKKNLNIKGLVDTYKENRVFLYFSNGETNIVIQGENFASYVIYGNVDRCFFVNNELLLISCSNFTSPYDLYLLTIKNGYMYPVLNRDNKIEENIKINYFHSRLGDRSVPCYISDNLDISSEIILMLHGGPKYHYVPEYDYISNYFVIKNFTVVKVNYTGSSGYGKEYMEKLYGNGGKTDKLDVLSLIEYFYQKYNKKITMIGESYGAYLGLLISFENSIEIKKIICINGFSDIRFQSLFSNSKKVIEKYFITQYEDHKTVNPIDIIQTIDINTQLVLLHSIWDRNCPIMQIENFYNEVINKNTIKFYKIKDISHYSYSDYDNLEKNKLIVSEVIDNGEI